MLEIRPGARVRGKSSSRELIPALVAELERLDHNALAFGAKRAAEFRAVLPARTDWYESEEAEQVLEELLCALTDCAGTDTVYFGRRTLGSDEFGFWTCED
jgi:hypothetical protein